LIRTLILRGILSTLCGESLDQIQTPEEQRNGAGTLLLEEEITPQLAAGNSEETRQLEGIRFPAGRKNQTPRSRYHLIKVAWEKKERERERERENKRKERKKGKERKRAQAVVKPPLRML